MPNPYANTRNLRGWGSIALGIVIIVAANLAAYADDDLYWLAGFLTGIGFCVAFMGWHSSPPKQTAGKLPQL